MFTCAAMATGLVGEFKLPYWCAGTVGGHLWNFPHVNGGLHQKARVAPISSTTV